MTSAKMISGNGDLPRFPAARLLNQFIEIPDHVLPLHA
jgi:hypothetical protein